ncbi:MAG: hypothetical protein GWP63_21825 [Haliea sp.]|nr:hypothetical protein [Haliea sp.]
MTDKVHILVVDDDLEIRELLARIPAVLRRSGHSGVPGGGQRVSFEGWELDLGRPGAPLPAGAGDGFRQNRPGLRWRCRGVGAYRHLSLPLR